MKFSSFLFFICCFCIIYTQVSVSSNQGGEQAKNFDVPQKNAEGKVKKPSPEPHYESKK